MKPVLPFFHPTTTVLIDDDTDTLTNLVNVLNLKKKPHLTFVDPRQGLAHIQADTYYKNLSKNMMCLNEYETEDMFVFRPEVLINEMSNPERYYQVSVLIIDYEMPGINGLEVCQEINHPYIKKIMLTGVANEKVGLEAFNQGLIYQYVRKQDPDFIEQLQSTIRKAQEVYFLDINNSSLSFLQNQELSATPFFEAGFKNYFEDLIKKHDIEEYYLVEIMGSFLMIDKNHVIHSLFTLDKYMMENLCDRVVDELSNVSQINAAMEYKLMPCGYNPFNRHKFKIDNLKEYLAVPTVIPAPSQNNTFYCAFGQGYIVFDPGKASFYMPS